MILICRNSTDTAFYQRLRPYPRVHLKRLAALFKDYSHTPIGFGISIFCLAKEQRNELYPKFYQHFGDHGEPNIPIDVEFVKSLEFWSLLDRLRSFTANHHRDHWVRCSLCLKWRIISWGTVQNLTSKQQWDCSMLDPPLSSCSSPLSKLEYLGGHYATKEEDKVDPESRPTQWSHDVFPEKILEEVDCNNDANGEFGEISSNEVCIQDNTTILVTYF